MLPKVRKRKWIEEDVRRARSISVAVSRIASGIAADQLREVELHQVSHGLLVAIRSEIETLVLDTEGIYVDVNLLVPDPSSDARLLVLNRANPDRHLNVSYKKEGMLVWETMQTGRYAYDPDFKSDDEKPYRSILAFPLIFENKDRTIKALGGISIDSSKAHHFDGLEKRLETKLLPYLTLLKLVLVCRGRYEGNKIKSHSRRGLSDVLIGGDETLASSIATGGS